MQFAACPRRDARSELFQTQENTFASRRAQCALMSTW